MNEFRWQEENILEKRIKIQPFDPVKASSSKDILEMLETCAFQGRKLAMAHKIWKKMIDIDAVKILTLSGAIVPAGMGEIIIQLIENRLVDVIITTGANMAHDLVNALSENLQGHYVGCDGVNDYDLKKYRVNRIYDVFVPETYYEIAEEWLVSKLDDIECFKLITPFDFHKWIGKLLSEEKRRCILSAAAENEIPIFCGAFSDSEIALDIAKHRKEKGITKLIIDEMGDINKYSDFIVQNCADAPSGKGRKSGIIILGGGMPRNWGQQIWPFLDMLDYEGEIGFNFTIRICTDVFPGYGNLSSSTESEGETWQKYVTGAEKAEVACDITIALPLLASALLMRKEKEKRL